MKLILFYSPLILIALAASLIQAKSTRIPAHCAQVKAPLDGQHSVPGKPGTGVCLNYHLPAKINPGQSFVVKLSFTNFYHHDLRSEIRVPAELKFSTKARSLQKAAEGLSNGDQQSLSFSAEQKGMYYIYVKAQTGYKDNHRTTVFAIPINVGGVDPADYLKTNGRLKTTADGEKIMSMKAHQNRH